MAGLRKVLRGRHGRQGSTQVWWVLLDCGCTVSDPFIPGQYPQMLECHTHKSSTHPPPKADDGRVVLQVPEGWS